MAGVSSKLSEVDMVLIYQARAFYEYKSRSIEGRVYWTEILEMAGVTTITGDEAERWVGHNYMLHRFLGTDGCLEWLKSNARVRNGQLTRTTLSVDFFRPFENIDILNQMAELYEPDLPLVIEPLQRQIPSNSLLTGLRNPRETHVQLYRRVNAARYFWLLTNSCWSDASGFVFDDEKLAAYLVKYNIKYEGPLQQLRLDLISFWGAFAIWNGLKYPDEDQNHAVFIFYRLVDWFSEGVKFDGPPNKKLFDDLVKRVYGTGNLGTRRKRSEWCTWFVRELFENPNGCQYFNANGPTLTRIRFELLRLGRESGWWGNPQLAKLHEWSKIGWGVRLGMGRTLFALRR